MNRNINNDNRQRRNTKRERNSPKSNKRKKEEPKYKLDKNGKVKLDKNGNPKKKMPRKRKIIIALSIILGIFLLIGMVFGVYLLKAKGNVKEAVLNIATDIVGDQDPIFVLILGVSEDISAKLTDTIILCGYNPSTQKAFMLSVPRDTYVGKNPSSANGYDKINAQFQKSAERTVESVELLTGVDIDYYVIVRNISITSIFECFGSIDFDVPINMNYDDPTQDLHIHLKKGYQTLEPNQIEQLLRFRHNNDGTSYPSSYGDNDYGRMRTQREFIKAAMEQILSLQNVGKLKDLAAMVYTNLQTNMSGYTVLDYVPHALKFSTSNLRSEQLPGQSAMINELWFYQASKSKTKSLVDELMIYLELDDKFLDSHYKYASEIKGVKPDQNWVSNTVVIDDEYVGSSKKDDKDDDEVVDPSKCEHQYAVYDDSDKASCEKTGTVTYKCLKCGTEYHKQTDALGHTYDKNGKCTRCGKIDKSKHKHKYSVEKDTATCTAGGTKTLKCSSCGETTTEKSKALGHNYSNGKCTRCGEKQQEQHTHKYTDLVSDTATCTAGGTKTLKCSCGETTTEKSKALGHNYLNGECTRCGEKQQEQHTHKYTELVNDTATCTAGGTKTLKCSCGETTTENSNPLGHDYKDGVCTRCKEKDPSVPEADSGETESET